MYKPSLNATIIVLISTYGCVGTQRPPAGDVQPVPSKCERTLTYAGHRFEIKGLAYGKFTLASGVWEDVTLQQAQQAVQALDVLQFGDCQMMHLLPEDDPTRATLLASSKAAREALFMHADKFRNASTPEEARSAATAAKADADELASKPVITDNAETKNPPEPKDSQKP